MSKIIEDAEQKLKSMAEKGMMNWDEAKKILDDGLAQLSSYGTKLKTKEAQALYERLYRQSKSEIDGFIQDVKKKEDSAYSNRTYPSFLREYPKLTETLFGTLANIRETLTSLTLLDKYAKLPEPRIKTEHELPRLKLSQITEEHGNFLLQRYTELRNQYSSRKASRMVGNEFEEKFGKSIYYQYRHLLMRFPYEEAKRKIKEIFDIIKKTKTTGSVSAGSPKEPSIPALPPGKPTPLPISLPKPAERPSPQISPRMAEKRQEIEDAKVHILETLADDRCWGKRHTPMQNVIKRGGGIEGDILKRASDELKTEGLLLKKPTGHGEEVYLNPNKQGEIQSKIIQSKK